jgi:hypothetical protein
LQTITGHEREFLGKMFDHKIEEIRNQLAATITLKDKVLDGSNVSPAPTEAPPRLATNPNTATGKKRRGRPKTANSEEAVAGSQPSAPPEGLKKTKAGRLKLIKAAAGKLSAPPKNKQASRKSKYRHVSDQNGRWRGQVTVTGRYFAKTFDDEDSAAEFVADKLCLDSIEELLREG